MIKQEVLYASKTLAISGKGKMENILRKERKIMKVILAARRTEKGYMLHKKETIQKLSNIATDIRKEC